ncbi:hypothetical protein KRP22_004902 [Phytophthora ramorum]|uniref:uncharacterized protein n=1 Tax=Phytophthora ramorum TaxID=164328 RepID=UPI0030AA73BE|nr:hypothetical protein KRP23_13501 [Phytophthora ramorum]KAH7497423.1 hypothetical protein KRP22_12486 [Phytophthora ramorum]
MSSTQQSTQHSMPFMLTPLPLTQPSQDLMPSMQVSLPLAQPSQPSQAPMPSLTQPTQVATPPVSLPSTQPSQLDLGLTGAQPSDVDSLTGCMECKVDQLKNKFQALKTTYNNIKASEPQTGNSTENPIVYPSNWPTLIQYCGDLSGMGNRDFGQTTVNTEAAGGAAAATEGAANKRAARKRKLDLAEAVASMAEALSKRLGQPTAADDRAEHSIERKFARVEERMTAILSNQEQSMHMLQTSIGGSRQVNTAILAFLNAIVTPEQNAEHEQQTDTP